MSVVEPSAAHQGSNPIPFDSIPPPLRLDPGGVVRIGATRISLDLVVEQYENGMSPEEMVRAYDTLALADVYAVIAYYLRNTADVREYLKRRAEEAVALREKVETERPRIAPDDLIAQRPAEEVNAPAGQ